MALDESNNSNGFFMPVAPAYGGGGGFGGNGNGFGGDWAWIILLLLLGWGNNGNGFGGGYGGGNSDFPWLMTGQQNINSNTNNGFRDAMINDNITSVRDGINSLSTQLCGCCGDMQMALANGFAGVEQGANARQIANMQTAFAAQMANAQGFNGVQAQIAEVGCDNRAAINDVKYTIASEECATRANSTQNTQSILNLVNSGIQSIKDQLCQDKIDAKNDEISALRQQIAMKDLAASQVAQNAFIAQGFANEVDQLYNRLNTCPVPTTPVYGRTPIFTCNQNQGCGCGCGAF
jgi:hypothetical protein